MLLHGDPIRATRSKAHIRPRVIALVVGAIALPLGLSLAWMTSVPGHTFTGAIPSPNRTLQDELTHDVTHLALTIGERNVQRSDSLTAARLHIEEQLRSAGLAPSLEDCSVLSHPCANVIADVAGTTHSQAIVVIGAHYDSAPGSPGANDNATGVAAMLALARRFASSSPARTLRFVAFVNEEPPYFGTDQMGSRMHARASRARGENIIAMLSLETLGCWSDEPGSQRYPSPLLRLVYPSRGNFVTFVSNLGSRTLLRNIVRTFRDHAHVPSEGGALPSWVSGVGWSDHASFWLEGFPAVMVTDTAVFRDPHYHQRSDAVEHVDFGRLALVVEALEAVIADLANPKPGS